jgi:hypothetical protein
MVRRGTIVLAMVSAIALWPATGWSTEPPQNDSARLLTRCTGNFATCEAAIAAAAKSAPDVTADFLAYCAGHFDACEDRIIMIDRDNTFSATWHCVIRVRGNPALAEAVKSILAWLAQHPETKAMRTKDGVTQAIAALWPC